MARQVFPTPEYPLIPITMGYEVAWAMIIFCVSFRPVNSVGSGGGLNRLAPLTFISEVAPKPFILSAGWLFFSFSEATKGSFESEEVPYTGTGRTF